MQVMQLGVFLMARVDQQRDCQESQSMEVRETALNFKKMHKVL